MDAEAFRTLALALPEAVEAPHFRAASFRVRGKIFATLPPDGTHAHVFLAETDREQGLALHAGVVETLFWGKQVAGVRIVLAGARPALVAGLLRQAWTHKAPRALVAGFPRA